MKKKLLILKASKDVCGNEVGLIKSQAGILGLDVHYDEFSSVEKLKEILSAGVKYDYFYLCSHGSKEGFELYLDGDSERKLMTWDDFSFAICDNSCLNPGCVFMLACCRGGLNQVAWDIFISCPAIDYVCGPSWTLSAWDITTGFIVFIYNMETKNAEPNFAATKASLATDYTFLCFDRVEVESQLGYNVRKQELEKQWSSNGERNVPDELLH